jgi:SNF2 family DNA or RNA helicase
MMSMYRMEGKIIEGVIVLCRLSLRLNWLEQLTMHCALPFTAHLPETSRYRAFEAWLYEPHDFKWLIVGFESLSAGRMAEMCRKFTLTGTRIAIIADESQYICNPKAERSKKSVSLARSCNVRIAMTGTPMRTSPMNLYMQFEFLDPEVIGIGDFYAFRNRYAEMGGYEGKEIIGYNNLEELADIVEPYTYQITKAEALPDLPPKAFQVRTVQISGVQKEIYRSFKKNWNFGNLTVQNVLEQALRLHQVVGGLLPEAIPESERTRNSDPKFRVSAIMRWNENPKIKEVLAVIDESGADKSYIVWARFKLEIEMICEAIRQTYGTDPLRITGDTPKDQCQVVVNNFQEKKNRFLVGNQETGGVGYTMTACDVMIYYNNTFSMVDRQQSEDRAHRKGLNHPVLYVDIVAEKTIDVTIMKSIKEKVDLTTYVKNLVGRKIKSAEIVFEPDDVL